MLDRLSAPSRGATSRAIASDSGTPPTVASDSGDGEWLAQAAQHLLGKDAGLHLHYITGYPESSCYKYVAKDKDKRRSPPEHFLRALFHSPQGEPFFLAFMEGCRAEWFDDLKRARRIVSAIDDQL